MILIASPGPGNGWRQTKRSGMPSSSPTRRPSPLHTTRLHVHELYVEMLAECLDDLFRLVLPEQSVVDEHAGQLVADGLVHEQRRNGGVDPARKRAQDALAPDLRADPSDLLLDHRRRRP